MRPITALRTQYDHTRRVLRAHRRIVELQQQYDNATTNADRAQTAEWIADLLNTQADHLEASWLARAAYSLPTPAGLRAEAAEWLSKATDLWQNAYTR
jgi:hypothetical protein